MIKILHIISNSVNKNSTGGTEQRTYKMMKYYKKQSEFIPICLYNKDAKLYNDFKKTGYDILHLPTASLKRIDYIFKYIKIIKDNQIDIVHIQGPASSDFYATIASKICNVPIIITRPSFNSEKKISYVKKKIFSIIDNITYRLSNKIILVYNNAQKVSELLKFKNKIEVIVNGVEGIKKKSLLKNKNLINLAMVAQFTNDKDQLGLIKILQTLDVDNKVIKLYFYGDGPNRKLCEEYVVENNIKNVLFKGFVNNESIQDELLKKDIFILKTFREGMPVSILEAMSASLPIVASNVGGVSEIVVDNYNGFLVDNFKDDDFKNKLLKLIESLKLREEFSKNSLVLVENKFSFKKMFDEHIILYEKVLNEK